jgi:hypothetical protein
MLVERRVERRSKTYACVADVEDIAVILHESLRCDFSN